MPDISAPDDAVDPRAPPVDGADTALAQERRGRALWRAGDPAAARAAFDRARDLGGDVAWIDAEMRALQTAARPDRFAGRHDRQPDLTGRRQGEGGARLRGHWPASRPGAPLVTIITAVYDNDRNFADCIASVRAQTWDNVEYIVIDGGSPAPTLDVIRTHEDAIDYWVSEPDLGIYAAMNKGIALARGDYVCLLNSDDTYDPDFVARAVARAQRTGADIVYTDYHHGATHLRAQPVGPGLLLGHMNICHNTFLVARTAYDRIGPYDERFRIVSDAIWMRAAWRAGVTFAHEDTPLFTLTEGGLSSGGSEAHRRLFIDEMARSYRQSFPQLDHDAAETLYLLRFDRKLLARVLEIARAHVPDDPLLRDALRGYLRYCLAERPNFAMTRGEATTNFPPAAALCRMLDLPATILRIDTSQGPLHTVLADLDAVIARRKTGARRTILHFVTVFSAPSETFIHDLITGLDARDDCDNFVLFEHAQLEAERPFDKRLQVAWRGYAAPVGQAIYGHIFAALAPDAVIAHFAINEHRLHDRIAPLGIQVPTLAMCHGIDVFELGRAGPYRDHVLGRFARRPDTGFTAVSRYLADLLADAGVPRARIARVPNGVSDRFFAHRKSGDFHDGTRPLKLLCIGRLIDWKGHAHLLDALARFRDRATRDVHLSIVYGRGDTLLKPIEAQIEKLGLTEAVTLIPFVDFAKDPGFMARFDLYVHPSTHDASEQRKSETFGVALLEAITAGLPVVTTDAGGLPEVVGDAAGPFARIVPHGDADALAAALEDIWRDRGAFADNAAYARDRLETFSRDRQIDGVLAAIDRLTAPRLKVALFSTSTVQGAGYAAYRLHRGLQDTGRVASDMFTTVRNHETAPGVRVLGHPLGTGAAWGALQDPPKPGKTIFSYNQTHIPSRRLLDMVADHDIINLHWHARFLSAENIATLTWSDKPVVLTVRDMMPITGGCHFFHGCDGWRAGCGSCPQIPGPAPGFAADVLAAKRAHWNFDNLTLVALSTHSRDILARAPLFSDCRIEVIPNSIETDVFRPYDRATQRRGFGLPADRPVIGYVPSFSSEVKGYRELLAAFDILAERAPHLDPFVLLVGNRTPATDAIAFDTKSLNYIADNAKLAQAYSAADVIVVPSLEETFSNTTAEAISCGVPVVGFRTGAIPDLALDGRTGYVAEPGDVEGLARGLIATLEGPSMGAACRAHAEATLAFDLQARAYRALYADLLRDRRRRPADPDGVRVFDAFAAPTAGLVRLAAAGAARGRG